ncbi:MAG TPA: alkyl sulfatase dimerization domain-containing protein [Caulobacteraceae bacterium]|jgi:alkyl sulfatase BDS1-like metallo-beta-lactamase superfamily hydrolase
MEQPKDASAATIAANRAFAARLPLDDGADFERIRQGFIATVPDGKIVSESRGVVWDLSVYDFENDPTPPETVNPSLWRQARLNLAHGLFKVTDGVYQIRGFDISNITFIEGERGYVVIDPLTTAEPAAAALALMRKHRGDKPVTAVIYTHSHVDHYGGVLGVLSEADIAAGARIIAPEGFLEEAVSENVLLGNVMNRRATYMYGALLPRGPKGHVDAGLGKAVSLGQPALVAPTESISTTGTRLSIDGVEAVFQVTPGTEAPAEMNFFFPGLRALCMAENCTCNLHNLYTPRGAQVRDAKAWSFYIDEAIELFAADADVLFASHHWPRWGKPDGLKFLTTQRDLYKYVHDQTLRMANHGMTPREIAEDLALPPTLAAEWHTRGYYGTLNHNAKAVYQRYLGWFDGNPANLHPLPPVESAKRYVDLAGGAEPLLAKARTAFEAGDYRWVAEVVNHLVFADPDNEAARALQADALEQMGYQAESGPWRAFYLTGAQELRNRRAQPAAPRQAALAQLPRLPGANLLDALSVRLNGPKVGAQTLRLGVAFGDLGERYLLEVSNAVLRHREGRIAPGDTVVTLTRELFVQLIAGAKTIDAALATGELAINGDAAPLETLLGWLDRFDFWFEIIEP